MAAGNDLRRAAAQAAPSRRDTPLAIVDIGSNSVRLVVYEGECRTAATVQNEKSICGIGRDMVSTGRLHPEGCAEALEALARFRLIADGLSVTVREAVATAAARDASNGAEFIAKAEKAWGSPIRILAGDNVSLEMSPYDLSKGRITFRHLERRGPPPSGGGNRR